MRAALTAVLVGQSLGCVGTPALALTAPVLIKESQGDAPAGAPVPCSAPANIDGNCGNYRWYNLCSGYIWIWRTSLAEVGSSFKALDGMPCIAPGNTVKRTITYFRNVVPNYNQVVDVRVNIDTDADGCAENSEPILVQHSNLDPALRWNCSNFAALIPNSTTALIVSVVHHGGTYATIGSDGAISSGPNHRTQCPLPEPHSFYYGPGRVTCEALVGPLGTYDNWLMWLVIDGPPTATQPATWGGIKGLYR